jgi:hypothetical protein
VEIPFSQSVAAAALAHLLALIFSARAAHVSAMLGEDDAAPELRRLLASAELRERSLDEPINDGTGHKVGRDVDHESGDGRAGGGQRAKGKEGAIGDRLGHDAKGRRYAVAETVSHEAASSLSREEALADAGRFGVIGALSSGVPEPHAFFADGEAHGRDAFANNGSMWGAGIGDAFGGGLGLTGVGEGGGGRGEGIGLGNLGRVGHRYGPSGSGLGGGGSRSWKPEWPKSWARWPVVPYGHQNHPFRYMLSARMRIRRCFEEGLRRNPDLAGAVVISFLIGRSGAVLDAQDAGSTLPDREVIACVVRVIRSVEFPPPALLVRVTYPIQFAPAAP